jgi:hypothetical protein
MKGKLFLLIVVLAALAAVPFAVGQSKAPKPAEWSMNATIIEACSCPMFCQCYFDTKPAAHVAGHGASHGGHGESEGEHFCKFNNAFRVNSGHHGATKLDGAKFWISGDLGDDFSDGETEWAVLTFDPAVTKAQRDGIMAAIPHVYPLKWKSFRVAQDAPVEWKAGKDRAHAKLNGGKNAEVILTRFQGMTSEPVVMHNLRYFGAPRNDGFVMMPNEVQAYRGSENPYEYKGTNGFMITFDINSNDVKK